MHSFPIQGQAYLNGFNLGRYWPTKGPQITLYVPAPILKASPANNTLILFELDYTTCGDPNSSEPCMVEFIDRPIINSTVSLRRETTESLRLEDEDEMSYSNFIVHFVIENLWAIAFVFVTTPSLLWVIF